MREFNGREALHNLANFSWKLALKYNSNLDVEVWKRSNGSWDGLDIYVKEESSK